MPAAKSADSPADLTAQSAPPATQPKITTRMWEALTHLSIGRTTGDPKGENLADIVHKGETVALTDAQAHGFLTRHRVPVIRPARQQNQAAPAIGARDLFGVRPVAQQFGARPDPDGASAVTTLALDPADPRNAPEANDPVTDLTVDPDAAKDK
jgi:hypothetical protein